MRESLAEYKRREDMLCFLCRVFQVLFLVRFFQFHSHVWLWGHSLSNGSNGSLEKTQKRTLFHYTSLKEGTIERQKVPSRVRSFRLFFCIKKKHTQNSNERPLYARGGVTRHERARKSEDPDERVDIIFNSTKKHH